ncbi:HPr family phosphocarrier protein [Verrucomicrobiota bacterium]
MVEGKATVQNEAGIHCRPTAVIIGEAAKYDGAITVISERGSTTLGSALEMMMLALVQGTQVTIQVDGPDEDATLKQFVDLFEFHFDFPSRDE